ncbi:MAG: hypothetical protein K0S22_1977 [Oscillospiraceae bacterium]|jgi:hypothetical protein|nr:hypothetical protein [Oscillospiraceae bacterium]
MDIKYILMVMFATFMLYYIAPLSIANKRSWHNHPITKGEFIVSIVGITALSHFGLRGLKLSLPVNIIMAIIWGFLSYKTAVQQQIFSPSPQSAASLKPNEEKSKVTNTDGKQMQSTNGDLLKEQLPINLSTKAEASYLTDKAYEVAQAYQDADQRNKDIVCLTLGLEPDKSIGASSDAAVALAYLNADQKSKEIICVTLGLELDKSTSASGDMAV